MESLCERFLRKLLLKSQGFAGAEALLWIFSSFVDGRVSSIKVRIHSLTSSQSLVCCIVGILESGWLSSGLSTAHLAENLEGIFKGVTSCHTHKIRLSILASVCSSKIPLRQPYPNLCRL